MSSSTKQELLDQVVHILDYANRVWADFLKEDCQDFIANLSEYRLENLLMNIEDFITYLNELDEEYQQLISVDELDGQAVATIKAIFLLSCVEFAHASKERMLIREMEGY